MAWDVWALLALDKAGWLSCDVFLGAAAAPPRVAGRDTGLCDAFSGKPAASTHLRVVAQVPGSLNLA